MSQDGRLVLASDGIDVYVWDTQLFGNSVSSDSTSAITMMSLSSPGTEAAVCDSGGIISLIDTESGKIKWSKQNVSE